VEMSQKSDSPKPSSERLVKDIRRVTRKQYSAEKKSALCWTVCAGRAASLNCAAARASPKACLILGRRSAWRPASVALPATRRARRLLKKRHDRGWESEE